MKNKILKPKKFDYCWVIAIICFLSICISLGFCSSGSAMYDSFAMAACASQDPNFDSENQTYASYFSEYMGQMDAVYSAVESAIGNLESAGKSYIVISVSSNYGIVKCEVLPATANPRQD